MSVTSWTSCIISNRKDLDNRIEGAGGLFACLESERRNIAEVEDGAEHGPGVDEEGIAVVVDHRHEGRIELRTSAPDGTFTGRLNSIPQRSDWRAEISPQPRPPLPIGRPANRCRHHISSPSPQASHPFPPEQTAVAPIPSRTAANGASRFSLVGRRHNSNRSGRGPGDFSSASTVDREGAVVPGRQRGRPSPGARGLCIAGTPTAARS
jgi:hypothetical protein